MRSLWHAADREALTIRLRRLDATTPPLWGSMTAPQMLAHLIVGVRFALGEVPAARSKSSSPLLRWWPVKYGFIYLVPFPRHAPTAPEFLSVPDAGWESQRTLLEQLLERVANRAREPGAWPEHPFFGPLSRRAWGVLGYAHMDHHLRQFNA